MKKLLITILFMLAAIGAYGQNKFKYPVNANGGLRVGGDDHDLIDSVKIVTGTITIYIGGVGYSANVDTTSLSDRINLKLNISDTSDMLNPYALLSEVGTGDISVSDTSDMLTPYIREAEVAADYIAVSDTSIMLTNYILTSEVNAAYANKALSNLSSVAINTHLLPGTDGAVNLGSATKQFGNIYIDTAKSVIWHNEITATHSNGTLTFSGGSIVLPSTTSIGTVDATEISHLNNTDSNIETHFGEKADTAGAIDIEEFLLFDASTDSLATLAELRAQASTFDSTYVHYRIDSLVTAIEEINTLLVAYVPPLFSSAEVGDSAARLLRVIMSKDMVTDSIPDDEQFVFTEGVDEIDVTSVSISNDTLFLVLATTPQKDSTLLIDYTKPTPSATNHTIEDANENETKTWVNKAVTNNGYIPAISKIELGEFADDTVLVVYNYQLDQDSVPPIAAFTFKEGGTIFGLGAAAAIGHDSLFIPLDSIGHIGLTYTLTYARDWPYVQDSAGYYAANFTNTAVTNNNTAAAYTDDFEAYSAGQLDGDGKWTVALNTVFVRDVAGDMRFSSNTNSAHNAVIYNDAFADDQYSQMVVDAVSASTSAISVGVRCSGSGATFDGYMVKVVQSNTLYLYRFDDGTATQITTGNNDDTIAPGDIIRLEVSGSALTVKVNGITIINAYSDATYSSGKAAIGGFSDLEAARGDDWAGGDL